MTGPLVLVAGAVVGLAVGLMARRLQHRQPRSARPTSTRQILLPFTGTTLSRRGLEAAMRLAGIEDATLMPAFLATVPRRLTLESPLPRQCSLGMPLLEAIEQRATAAGIPVDARIERGRSYRHALSRLLERERFDRVVISATDDPAVGLSGSDLLWLLENANAEVLILRPAREDLRVISARGLEGHF